MPGMLAGTRYRGDFEERLTNTLDEIAADGDTIVFVDELHTLVGAGGNGESNSMDAGNILKPRLARGDLHLLGATTPREFRTIEKDSALARRFQPVMVGEPSIEDAVTILDGLSGRYADHHGVTYDAEAIRARSNSRTATSPTGTCRTRRSTSSIRPERGSRSSADPSSTPRRRGRVSASSKRRRTPR